MPIYSTKFVIVGKTSNLMSAEDLDKRNLVYGEQVTIVELQDEAGGYFFEIKQPPNPWNVDQEQCIRLGFDEIEDLFQAITKLKEESERSLK